PPQPGPNLLDTERVPRTLNRGTRVEIGEEGSRQHRCLSDVPGKILCTRVFWPPNKLVAQSFQVALLSFEHSHVHLHVQRMDSMRELEIYTRTLQYSLGGIKYSEREGRFFETTSSQPLPLLCDESNTR